LLLARTHRLLRLRLRQLRFAILAKLAATLAKLVLILALAQILARLLNKLINSGKRDARQGPASFFCPFS